MNLLRKIETGQARVAIIGLGYVGLPLACEFARGGFSVVGVDNDPKKVEQICAGRSYVQDVSDTTLNEHLKSGRLEATTEMASLETCDAIIICVPTPLRKTRDPDISYIVAAVDGRLADRSLAPRVLVGEFIGECQHRTITLILEHHQLHLQQHQVQHHRLKTH